MNVPQKNEQSVSTSRLSAMLSRKLNTIQRSSAATARSFLNKATNLAALLSEDSEVFSELVRRESPRSFYIILQVVQDEDEAHSVLQETFFKAYIGLCPSRRQTKLSTWLYSIGRNQTRLWLRKKHRCITMEGKVVDRIRSSSPRNSHAVQQNGDPYTQLKSAEHNRSIRKVISNLPSTYRQVVVLRDRHGLSTAETARVLNISEDAVRVRLCRARRVLRVLLREMPFADEKSPSHH